MPGPVRDVPVTVSVKDTPPADLLRCPDEPEGFPENEVAQLPTAVRAAVIRIATAFRVNAIRLRRLVNWADPGACPAKPGQPGPR